MTLRPVLAVLDREILRLFRQRSRLLAAMVRPMIWLFVIGTGFGAMLAKTGNAGYQYFLVPGVLGMSMLFAAMLSALSMVYDKESGVMRMLITAPFARAWIVIAKSIAATITAVIQCILILVLLGIFGYLSWSINWLLLLLGIVLTSIACAGIGMLVAAWTRTLDNFAMVMNFVTFPVFFLSGSLYPVNHLPHALKLVALINPYTYGVDLLKHALPTSHAVGFSSDFSIAGDILVLIAFSMVATAVAGYRFSREEAYAPLFPTPVRKAG